MRTSLSRVAVGGALLSLGLGLSACGAGNETASGDTKSDSTLSGNIKGAGSSAQEAAQGAWAAGFQTDNPDVTVDYDPIGSGGGREQFIAGGVDFAGSDSSLSTDEGELDKAKERCGGSVIEVPDYVSPIAVVFNVDGVDDLQLSGETVAKIFNGQITSWDDPAIKADNPDAELPSEKITPVHRGDASGTTKNFTAYLQAAAPDVWTDEPDDAFPIKGGEAATGTSGVIQAVQGGKNTIGYADASQAGDLGTAKIKVGDEYVAPSAEAAAKILEISPQTEGRDASDLVFDLDRKTEEKGVYPVVLTSYLLACPTYDDQKTADLVKAFVSYVVSKDGQQAAADNAGSAPLPSSIEAKALKIAESIGAK
ncbi:phosphate ABC transporter substrate-binding protein PstS [Nocardioides marmoribigeumensis]|uniref:Phosphate-binding protein n=1 Tax=Nocardioides marmoribigeumensis TaxID=433649 RepID=A0ABU2BWT2_9ACTN|nr:phosphate ABC transporter substrate-binding protein PstS [Nocardioides marmoribigeumensis]MDR7362134.1 phosphate transport system substrate-binding protein [Nocardioides marmoribigeumensis]